MQFRIPASSVILDPEYGDRLTDVWPGQPVWIVLSRTNEPLVRSLWATRARTGITGWDFDPKIAPEDFFLAELDMIDLHHGPHSTNTPYTEFEVVGCPLTTLIREALTQLGFTDFDYRQSGFIAKRTVEEAAMQRP